MIRHGISNNLMYTCYLFADNFDDENCLSIRLDKFGNIADSLEIRSLDEFRILQNNSRTVVVVSSQIAAIHSVDAPLLNDTKARPVIAYALEEKLAEPVTNLHFAFDKRHYTSGKYLVVVLEKNYLFALQNKLSTLQLEYNAIICDWFALNQGSACVVANRYIVNDVNFKGALDLDLFDEYLKSQQDFSHILMFNDSPALQYSEKFTKLDYNTYEWLAIQLFKSRATNICQGEFSHNTNREIAQKYLKYAGILAVVWFVWLLSSNIIAIILLNKQIATYDEKIALVYRKFFPEAKQVISPRFRINQLLQKNQVGYNATFWKLLAKFATTISNIGISKDVLIVKQIDLRNSSLTISIACRDFEILEKIETALQKDNIHIHKSGVVTKGNKVMATLELMG